MPADAAIDALLEGLNPPQREAVMHGEGPLLILAGAGSGKTRVLTHRIAYLLRTGKARADEILAITFTNKAAGEMRERVELLVGRAIRAMWVMTFHSACARIMRAEDDLLVRTVNVLELFEPARERWRRAFGQVLVDEYQDTNRAQYRLLQLLASEHRNVFVVGDDSQSIYSFRHADIRNILDFEQDFPDADVVKLEQNYRSTQTILSATNALIEHNRENRPKRLWTEIAGSDPVQLAEL